MLQRLFTKPVELNINEKTVIFNSIDDFEFAVGARTAISLDKITQTIKSSIGELNLEANSIAAAIENLSGLVSQSPDISSGITMRLKSINSAIFSKDNGWRDIINALNNNESIETCKYKQIALTTYIRYLSNRMELIKSVQEGLEKGNVPVSEQEKRSETIELGTGGLKSDPTILSTELRLESMPKGEAVEFELEEGSTIDLLLSIYKCKIVVQDGIKFIDFDNNEFPVEKGKTKVGRGKDCTIKFDDDLQELSRTHLIILNHDDKNIELIDMSTHGTYFRHCTS